MEHPGQQSIVGVGELLWDCFDDGRRPGGAPANVVFHAAQLGHPSRIASRLGRDDLGSELRLELEERGLSTELVQQDDTRPTGRVTVDRGHPDRPDYVIHRGVAWEAIELVPVLERRVREAAALCVGTLAQRGAVSRVTIQRCLELARDALRVYDVNLRRDGYTVDAIVATLERSRVVKLNLDEVEVLSRLLSTDAREPLPFARELRRRHGIELVCVTRGAQGSLIVAEDEQVDTPGAAVEVADSVGAGDAFTAGLISGLLRGWSLGRTALLANRLGALVASRDGAMPALGEEIPGMLAELAEEDDR